MTGWVDLASRKLGGAVLAASDEFYAAPEHLILPEPPVFRPQTFTTKGQEYDGWETRRSRRRASDHDWVVIRLGVPGIVRTLTVDTAFFVGNHPPFAAVDGCGADGYPDPADLTDWQPILPRSPLFGDTANKFTVDSATRFTHVRLRTYPDGGVARLRVHGVPVPDPRWLDDLPFDLAALVNGGSVTECSDSFFSPPDNMLQPGGSLFMSDGWENARRRDDGNDWAVVRLAAPGVPTVLEIDTTHYKGNAPDEASVSGLSVTGDWQSLLPRTRLQPDTPHRFRVAVDEPVTHLRIDVYPDGGIARFRAYGTVTEDGMRELRKAFFEALPSNQVVPPLGNP